MKISARTTPQGTIPRQREKTASPLPLLGFITWAGLIFLTSCRYIDRTTFVHAVGRHIPTEAINRDWAALWLAWGWYLVKGYHVVEFAVLYALLYATLCRLWARPPARLTAVSLWICLLYAISDEWHQTWVPGRGGRATDVAIDSIGIFLTAAVVLFIEGHRTLANGPLRMASEPPAPRPRPLE